MPTMRRLEGRRLAVLAADGFEKVELVVPLRALKAAGATVDVVSLRHGRIRGVNLHMPATRVRVDKTVPEADPADYNGLLVPGGFINPNLLRQSAAAREFVRGFAAQDKPIATLCHGPWVLASAGLLDGRTLTSWPGIRDDLARPGARPGRQPDDEQGAAGHGRLRPRHARRLREDVTGAGADGAPCLRRSTGGAGRVAVAALRWSPKPSAAAVAGIGLAAAARRALRGPTTQR